jgi:hypothetical protein
MKGIPLSQNKVVVIDDQDLGRSQKSLIRDWFTHMQTIKNYSMGEDVVCV